MKLMHRDRSHARASGGASRPTGGWIKRVALFAAVGLVALYLLGATGGYIWVRHARKNQNITFLDVALLRWKDVRRGLAAQQFAKAKLELDAGNQRAAFLAYTFAVNNDPENVGYRLAAADFLRTAGSAPMATALLEAGLARAPHEQKLIERTFDLLCTTGRDRRALELLRQRPATLFSDPNGPMLRTYELQALLNLGDAKGAGEVLENNRALEKNHRSIPVVARVLWETQQRLRAIELLSNYVRTQPDVYSAYAQLAEWQMAVGMNADAVHTAERACQEFKNDLTSRLLLIEAQGAHTHCGREWLQSIESCLDDLGNQPHTLATLAGLAGRKGWVELARSLYELSALRQPDIGMVAVFYSDALMRHGRFKEAQEMLAQIEAQALEAGPTFTAQLRHRQVIAASAMGDSSGVREFTRRLAAVLHNDPEGLEKSRRHFQKSGIVEALAELSGSPAAVVATRK